MDVQSTGEEFSNVVLGCRSLSLLKGLCRQFWFGLRVVEVLGHVHSTGLKIPLLRLLVFRHMGYSQSYGPPSGSWNILPHLIFRGTKMGP